MASRDAAENSFAASVLAAFTAWIPQARQAVMRPWVASKRRPDPRAIDTVKPLWIRLVDGLRDELRVVAQQGYSEVANTPQPKNIQLIEQTLAKSYQLMVGIPQEIQHEIQGAINAAVNAGKTPEQIAQVVDDILDVSGSERWVNRARAIARTEVHRSANVGVQAAGMAISRLESVRLNKKWTSLHDNPTTRVAHKDADGQVVGLNQTFKVGTDRLLFPGDPTAPPETVINCRCALSILDTDGRR